MGYKHTLGFKNMVYETNYVICELVQHPSSTGHMTISPKKLSPDLEDCNPHDIAGCIRDLPRIAKALEGSLSYSYILSFLFALVLLPTLLILCTILLAFFDTVPGSGF
jgi:hypothetical protein